MTGTVERLRGLTRDVFVPAMSDNELDAALPIVWAAEQEIAALRLSLVQEASCRDIPRRQGAVKTSMWLADKLRISSTAAAKMVTLADALETIAPATGEALAAGALNIDQATVLTRAVRFLPAHVRAEGEAHMLTLTDQFAAPQLRTLAAHLADIVDPDGAEKRRQDLFARKERRDNECGITFSRLDGDDLWKIRGTMNSETAAILHAALDPLCNPRRHRNPTTPPQNASTTSPPPTTDQPPDVHQPWDTRQTPTAGPAAETEPSPGAHEPDTHQPSNAEPPAKTPPPNTPPPASARGPSGVVPSPGAESPLSADLPAPPLNAAAPDAPPHGDSTSEPTRAATRDAVPTTTDRTNPGTTDDTTSTTADRSSSVADNSRGQAEEPATVIEDTREPGADLRTAAARRLQALKDICLFTLAGGRLPDNGGDRPQLVITIPWEHLRDQVGAGTLDNDDLISPGDARRLACDSTILPAVLNGQSVPLDLGRERRLVTGPLRRALDIRDRGCSYPGCDRPRQWCSAHHIQHWADGGPTSLANSVLICDHHHHVIHQGEWEVRLNPHDHLPEYIPPAQVDPLRRPRRNTYHVHAHTSDAPTPPPGDPQPFK